MRVSWLASDVLLGTSLKMHFFVHHAVIACPCVDEYRCNWRPRRPLPQAADSAIPFLGDGEELRVARRHCSSSTKVAFWPDINCAPFSRRMSKSDAQDRLRKTALSKSVAAQHMSIEVHTAGRRCLDCRLSRGGLAVQGNEGSPHSVSCRGSGCTMSRRLSQGVINCL